MHTWSQLFLVAQPTDHQFAMFARPLVPSRLLPSLLLLPFRPLPTRHVTRDHRLSWVVMGPPAADHAKVSLFFERPLRSFLQGGARRKDTLSLPTDAPLEHLLRGVRDQLDERGTFALQASHGRRPMQTDEDLRSVIAASESRGVDVLIKVALAPGAELPPPPPSPGPLDGGEPRPVGPQQMVSFFRFAPLLASELPLLRFRMLQTLGRLHALGSVYIAAEGVNAQLIVPQSRVGDLGDELRSLGFEPNFAEVVDAEARPFDKLVVKERAQVLTDGLEETLDWARAGRELSPEEWHRRLTQPMTQPPSAEGAEEQPARPLLLDCRNVYETDVGRFEGAEPVGTETFSETWEALRERLAGVPSDAPIMTYCTGGIRCVKVNAFLEQQLGFTNTMRLHDGINGYLRHLRTHPDEPSAWQGKNFVFDKRETVEGGDRRERELVEAERGGEREEGDAYEAPPGDEGRGDL